MKTKFSGILTLLLAFVVQLTFAQEKTISGTVSDVSGLPLPGVNILVKGTTTGTQTDFDGKYSLKAQSGDVLTFSYIGLKAKEVTVGTSNTINVTMEEDTAVLDEVVVTALGIKRDEKSLGYASQNIGEEDITTVRDANVVNSLSGKIAGVHVTKASSAPGASSRIVLRGVSSIYGNAQPLMVVDGIPIDNTAYGSANSGGGQDVPNGLADINQDDIETINVLKGGAATALYGMRGANGVIVITTKSGKMGTKKLGLTISSSVQFDQVALFPSYQNSYGQGNNLNYFEYKDGYGTSNAYTSGLGGLDESWGPPLDVGLEFIQWNSFDGQPLPWVSAPDGVKNFYNTGIMTNNNVALEGASENADYRISMGYLDQAGVMHNTDYTKYNFSGNVNFEMSDRWTTGISFNYIKSGSDNLPNLGYDTTTNGTQTAQLVWAARQIDFNDLRDWRNLPLNTTGVNAGTPVNWNQAYNNNPFWALETNRNTLEKDRLIGNINVGFKILDNLILSLKTGVDYFSSLNTSRAAFGTAANEFGYYNETDRTKSDVTTDFILSYNANISEDFKFNLNAGGGTFSTDYHRNFLGAPQLQLPGVYNISNTRDGSIRVISQNREKSRVNSLYGFGQVSFRDYLFLDVTGRNDWASVLPLASNSFFYPSVSMSAVISDMLNLDNSVVSFLKLRGGWAKTGSAGPLGPYNIEPSYQFSANPWGTTPIGFLPNTLWNPNIKNELTTEYEVGMDARFFQSRLRFDITYYDKKTEDVILPVSTSATSGFTSAWDNAASITNKGVEINLGVKVLKSTDGLNLDLNINWAKNTNKVDDIDSDPTTNNGAITLGGLWNVSVQAREGEPLGVLYGPAFARADNGEILYRDGIPTYDPTYQILGNTTPDWTGGLGVNLAYKGLSLSTLFDVKWGGDVYSQTNSWGKYAGVLEETLPGRENGVVGQGVDVATNAPNNIVRTAEDFHKAFYGPNIAESSVYDASYIKWRELALTYRLPQRLFKNTGVNDVTLGVNVRNLLILYKKVPHIDPETSFGNTSGQQGLEYAQIPPTRTYGVNLNIKF